HHRRLVFGTGLDLDGLDHTAAVAATAARVGDHDDPRHRQRRPTKALAYLLFRHVVFLSSSSASPDAHTFARSEPASDHGVKPVLFFPSTRSRKHETPSRAAPAKFREANSEAARTS